MATAANSIGKTIIGAEAGPVPLPGLAETFAAMVVDADTGEQAAEGEAPAPALAEIEAAQMPAPDAADASTLLPLIDRQQQLVPAATLLVATTDESVAPDAATPMVPVRRRPAKLVPVGAEQLPADSVAANDIRPRETAAPVESTLAPARQATSGSRAKVPDAPLATAAPTMREGAGIAPVEAGASRPAVEPRRRAFDPRPASVPAVPDAAIAPEIAAVGNAPAEIPRPETPTLNSGTQSAMTPGQPTRAGGPVSPGITAGLAKNPAARAALETPPQAPVSGRAPIAAQPIEKQTVAQPQGPAPAALATPVAAKSAAGRPVSANGPELADRPSQPVLVASSIGATGVAPNAADEATPPPPSVAPLTAPATVGASAQPAATTIAPPSAPATAAAAAQPVATRGAQSDVRITTAQRVADTVPGKARGAALLKAQIGKAQAAPAIREASAPITTLRLDAALAAPLVQNAPSDQPPVQPLTATPAAPAPALNTSPIATPNVGAALAQQVLDMASGDAWIDGLARDISRTAGQDGAMRFRLAPETLGELKVEITHSERGAHVRLNVASEGAQQALVAAEPKLVAEARAQGVRIAETEVNLTGGQSQSSGQGREAGRQPSEQSPGHQGYPASRGGRGSAANDFTDAGEPQRSRRTERYA